MCNLEVDNLVVFFCLIQMISLNQFKLAVKCKDTERKTKSTGEKVLKQYLTWQDARLCQPLLGTAC